MSPTSRPMLNTLPRAPRRYLREPRLSRPQNRHSTSLQKIPKYSTYRTRTKAKPYTSKALRCSYFEFHPIFKRMTIDHSRFQKEDTDTHLNLILINNRPIQPCDLNLLRENAVTPAVGSDIILIEGSNDVYAKSTEFAPGSRKAVRVLDVVAAITRYVQCEFSSLESIHQDISTTFPHGREGLYRQFAQLWDYAKIHLAWNGDLEVQIDKDDFVHVVVMWRRMMFGS